MTYKETLDFLFSQLPMYQRVGAAAYKVDLENIIELCAVLGNPQNNFPSIHLAGTNGKGSTAHLIAAVFQARGLKVGLHTSPHYRDFRERIKINGVYISEMEVIDWVEKNKTLFEKLQPSFFEMTVAMTFDYFSKMEVDIAIIETGLGGRLDSTNILNPELSVITNIGLDHQKFLGNTLSLIAGEKAGIIKKETPVIIGETHPETKAVFENKAKSCNAPIYFADQNYQAKLLGKTERGQLFQILKNDLTFFPKLELNLNGNYQAKNLLTAIQTIKVYDELECSKKELSNQVTSLTQEKVSSDDLREMTPSLPIAIGMKMSSHSLEIFKNSILLGMSQVRELTNMIGRWETLGEFPKIIADSAHNGHGLKMAMDEIKSINFNQLHFVLGVVSDKNLEEILQLFPKEAIYYFAKPNIPRGMKVEILAEKANEFGLKGKAYDSVMEALEAAKKNANSDDLIYVGGSTFVVAEVV